VPFALAFDRYDHVVLAEAAPNAVATFTLRHDGKLTALSSSATGQAATCWIVGANGAFYWSNAGGSLSRTGSASVPDGAASEGIAAF
jgi:hypothetical protein